MMLLVLAAAAVDKFAAPPRTPSSAALAEAVTSFTHRRVNAAEVRDIRCEGLFHDPQDDPNHSPPAYACKWEEKTTNGWIGNSSYFEFGKQQWRLKEHPDSDLPVDPSSAEEQRFRKWLISHLRKSLANSEGKLSYRYGYAFVDLNGDREKEALVTIRGRDTCGTGGCEMDVEVERGGLWHELSSTVRTREPIKMLSTKHHGWHDLAVFDAGGGLPRAFESEVTFDGRKYQSSPSDRPIPKHIHGQTVLTDAMVNRPLF